MRPAPRLSRRENAAAPMHRQSPRRSRTSGGGPERKARLAVKSANLFNWRSPRSVSIGWRPICCASSHLPTGNGLSDPSSLAGRMEPAHRVARGQINSRQINRPASLARHTGHDIRLGGGRRATNLVPIEPARASQPAPPGVPMRSGRFE